MHSYIIKDKLLLNESKFLSRWSKRAVSELTLCLGKHLSFLLDGFRPHQPALGGRLHNCLQRVAQEGRYWDPFFQFDWYEWRFLSSKNLTASFPLTASWQGWKPADAVGVGYLSVWESPAPTGLLNSSAARLSKDTHCVCVCIYSDIIHIPYNESIYNSVLFSEQYIHRFMRPLPQFGCFCGILEGKESACNAGDPGLIPALGRSPGEGNGNLLQYSYLEKPMDGGAWQATDYGVTKSQSLLSE